LSEGEFEGLSAGLEEAVAELELGGAEGAPFVGHEVAGNGQEFVGEGLLQVGGELLGAGFLVGSERCRGHVGLRGRGMDFRGRLPLRAWCTKILPTFEEPTQSMRLARKAVDSRMNRL